MQTSAFRGSLTVTSFRLCSRAPWTTSSSAAIPTTILPSERTFPFDSPIGGNASSDALPTIKQHVSRKVLLALVVVALALPPAASAFTPSHVRGSGNLQPGCPTDALAA